MPPRVLLVDPDVEALGEVASALRSRGFAVSNACDPYEAVETAYRSPPDALVVAASLDADGEITQALRLVPQLAQLPVIPLPESTDELGRRVGGFGRQAIDDVVTRILDACPGPRSSVTDELRGNLSQMTLPDLIQMLAMNRRSGVVLIDSPAGRGEIRLAEGEIIDARFRRLEGEKALFRLLRARAGQFDFRGGDPEGHRRIEAPTSSLLMEAMRHSDEVSERVQRLGASGYAFVARASGEPGDPSPVSHDSREIPSGALMDEILRRLRAPRTLDELLDELPTSDLAVLEAVAVLESGGQIRRVELATLAARVVPESEIATFRSVAARLARAGFGQPRLVLATPARRLSLLTAVLARLVDVRSSNEDRPLVDVARRIGALRLGDEQAAEVELCGLPVHEAFAPTWPLALAGAAAVVRTQQAGGALLEAACAVNEVHLLEADTLIGVREPHDPELLATMLRRALEVAAGI